MSLIVPVPLAALRHAICTEFTCTRHARLAVERATHLAVTDCPAANAALGQSVAFNWGVPNSYYIAQRASP